MEVIRLSLSIHARRRARGVVTDGVFLHYLKTLFQVQSLHSELDLYSVSLRCEFRSD
jgi:hypothetical protein